MISRSVISGTRLAAVLLITITIFGIDRNCHALQYEPIDAFSSADECALVLDGPGRSSVFDYTYNLLRGSFPPSSGGQTCITYDAVNHAYIEARKRIHVAQPNTETWRGEDLATVGELLLDISINLAQKYGLTYEDIEKGLPLIDTSKTLIREVCPAFLSNVECRPGKYRRYDGLCTNLDNPTWGATMTPFSRLLPPKYADGINAPRTSATGNQLPLARVVSRTMHPDDGYHDHAGTVMVIAWGQFMDHDYTLTATPLDSHNRNDPEECCHRPPHQKNPYCNEILIPEDDYFYRLFNVRCMDFVRGFPAPRPGCRLGSRVQFNLLTGVLDGNTVYGVSETFARKLRTGYGGLLRMNPVFSEYGLKDLLPLKLDIPDEGCTRPNRSMYCFEAGEIRVNEQLVLTCMHTLLAREHNRAANALAHVNPHWDDETIFQEARRIVIAEIQHVTYNEFLPILLGKEVMEKFGLLLEKDGYWDGYDPSVNPGVIDAFAAAAYRFGHSLLPTAVERWSKAHKFIASKRLSDLIRRPYDLYRAGVLDEYFMGLMNQVAQAMDDSITQEVTNHLFKKVGAKFGMDLVSFNMQRGREFGLPSYMEFRKFCGLPGADTFEELFGSMPNETIRRYSSIFEHPSDVDLWSGGVSERPLPGSMLGPTFACIIATQFSYSRRGDRFWYELPNQPSSFTPEQLTEIKKARLSRLICDNTDLIDTIQIYPMVLPDHEINPRVPCRSGILPSIDFSKWAEFPPSQSDHAAQYNFLRAAWPFPGRIFMPPLAYGRMHRTPNHRAPTSIALELAGLHTAMKRTNSLYVNREISRRKRKPKTWPTILIERSTRIYGEIPSVADDNIRGYQGRTTRPDYFFERSEVAISPIIDDIFRGKRYSIKNLFNDLSMKTVSKSLSGFRFRRDANDGEGDDEKSNDSPQTENNYSRLLKILARDRVHGRSEYDADNARNFHSRSKRHVGYEDKDFGGKVEAEEKLNNDAADEETEASQKKRRIKTSNEGYTEVTRKHRYTPVFKECNDTTAASEVADLNAPPPPTPPPQQRRATLREYYRNGGNIQDIDLTWNEKAARNQNKYDDDSKIPLTTIPPAVEEDDEEPAQKEAVSTTKNETYINLQDHQKDAQVGTVPKDSNGYPVDIPAYNPDAIPYVDVPDYSDQREESLDKDDRKVAKEKYVEYPDEEADVIDPELLLTNNGKRSEKIIVRDEDVQEPEEVKEEVEEERGSDEEETEKSPFTSLGDESEENKEKENEETISKNVRSDVTDDSYDFGPIHFDIEEYKKPFNLEELFKDIEKEVEEKNATKGDVNEHQGSKNIPVRGDSNEARGSYKPYWDDGDFKAFESPLVKTRGDKLTEKNVANNEEKSSPQDSTLVPPNFFEEFDRVFGPAASDKPFFTDYFREDDEEKEKEERLPVSSSSLVKNDGYPYGDENTYENLFATDGNRNKSKSESKTTKDNDDDVYYKKYSDHDVADFLEEKKAEAEAEEPYKTLATILDKKDDISRLDDEVSTKAKMEGKVPNKYNNFWTLEYGSPDRSEKT